MRVEEGMQAETVQAISWQLQTELCPTQILLANKFLSQAGDIEKGLRSEIRLMMRGVSVSNYGNVSCDLRGGREAKLRLTR